MEALTGGGTTTPDDAHSGYAAACKVSCRHWVRTQSCSASGAELGDMLASPALFQACLSTRSCSRQALREDAELRRKQDIHEVEERKNAHIQDLMKKHEKVGLCEAWGFLLLAPVCRAGLGEGQMLANRGNGSGTSALNMSLQALAVLKNHPLHNNLGCL